MTDHTSAQRSPGVQTTCFVQGLAVLLQVRTPEMGNLMELLRRVDPRLDRLDRAKLRLPARPVPGAPTTATTEPPAPKECLDAWRADRIAPVHCEEYPDAYAAIRRARGGG